MISLTSSASDAAGPADPLTYSWSVLKNGTSFATGSSAALDFTPDDDGVYVVSLTVSDGDSGIATDIKTITVTNVAPLVTIADAPATSPEGTAIALNANVNDAGGTADVLVYAWSVTKNGSAYATGSTSSLSFTPDDNGTYVVTLSVDDGDGGVTSDSKTITVTNVAPTVAIVGAPTTSPEATAISLTSTASDVAGAADPLVYSWSVTKNGSAYATGSTSALSFTPDDNGTYVVTCRWMMVTVESHRIARRSR